MNSSPPTSSAASSHHHAEKYQVKIFRDKDRQHSRAITRTHSQRSMCSTVRAVRSSANIQWRQASATWPSAKLNWCLWRLCRPPPGSGYPLLPPSRSRMTASMSPHSTFSQKRGHITVGEHAFRPPRLSIRLAVDTNNPRYERQPQF